jgi:hypothetical protein
MPFGKFTLPRGTESSLLSCNGHWEIHTHIVIVPALKVTAQLKISLYLPVFYTITIYTDIKRSMDNCLLGISGNCR